MTDTAVTTCGVTIFEISQTTPITIGKQDDQFDEACPTETADLLERNRLLLDVIAFVRCVCLDEDRCVDILIHDDCIHNRSFE